jgi:hypothetical protein
MRGDDCCTSLSAATAAEAPLGGENGAKLVGWRVACGRLLGGGGGTTVEDIIDEVDAWRESARLGDSDADDLGRVKGGDARISFVAVSSLRLRNECS